jgi:hypothetical protein
MIMRRFEFVFLIFLATQCLAQELRFSDGFGAGQFRQKGRDKPELVVG